MQKVSRSSCLSLILSLTMLLGVSSFAKTTIKNEADRSAAEIAQGVQELVDQEAHVRAMMEANKLAQQEAQESKSVMKFFSLHDDPRCDDDRDDNRDVTCVKRCSSRYSDGTCASYGTDFCGRQAKCAAKCTSRYSDGTCASYGADECGRQTTCAKNCSSRYSDGTCASYAADSCGRNAYCAPNCTSRYSDGTCASYGADVCN